MSLEDIFDEFDGKKEDKTVPEEAIDTSKELEGKGDSVTEEDDKSKEEVEEEDPTPSKEEDDDDWFAPAVDEPTGEEPTKDRPADDQPVEEESVEEKTEEPPAAETPDDVGEEWFVPATEEQAPAEIPTKVSVDIGTLVGVEASPIVCQAVTAEEMKAQMQQFQNLKASLLDKNTDIATIQNKPYIKRSGWRKMGLAFNLSDEIVKEVRDEIDGGFLWRIWVRVWAPNGRSVVGIGGCCSDERDFAHLEHDVYATAHTRAKNRALSDMIGSGEVSWEELRGFA